MNLPLEIETTGRKAELDLEQQKGTQNMDPFLLCFKSGWELLCGNCLEAGLLG